jgi:hypothetical protein
MRNACVKNDHERTECAISLAALMMHRVVRELCYEFGSQKGICVTFMSYKMRSPIRYNSVIYRPAKIYAGRRKQLKNKNTFAKMIAVYQANTSRILIRYKELFKIKPTIL